MSRSIPTLALLAALLLTTGCFSAPENNLPFTAAEADKFVADNPAIMAATKQAMLQLGTTDYEGGVKLIAEAQETKIRELGWDHDRYTYIHSHFYDALSHESLRLAVEDWKKEAAVTPSKSQRERLRANVEDAKSTLRALQKQIESRTTIAERVLIHERLQELAKDIEGGIRTFQNAI